MTKRLNAGLLACALGATLAAAPSAAADTPAASAAKAATALTSATSATSGASGAYIVRAAPGQLDAVANRVEALGGDVTRRLGIIDAVAATLSATSAARLDDDPRVVELTRDARVKLQSTYAPANDPNSMHNVTGVIQARVNWSKYTGKGVDVALIDSGITPVEGLATAGKVVYGPDLSFESQSADLRNKDTFGHGTHMAGIIAGKDTGADPLARDTSPYFMGVAPDARLVSLKVADAYGATDVSQVVAAIDWVVQHRKDPGFNIRVLNLSFGTASKQSYVLDPLSHAAEVAWRAGIVVIVSAGNDGTGTGKLLTPAQNPTVLAVGADSSRGTLTLDDDVIPSFSTRGDGVRNPDLVAPGTSIQSLRVPGSYVDTQYAATGAIDDRFFRGSGTSQSAAVVSGAVAMLLQQRPTMTPDQVKALLRGTTTRLPVADAQAQGRGIINVKNAISAQLPTTTQSFTRSTGTGTLDAARGGDRLTLDGVTLAGETDIFGKAFSSTTHAGLAQNGTAWTGGTWNGSVWTGSAWASGSWQSATWAGNTWSGRSWAGRSWAGGYWNGRSWASQSWTDPNSTTAGTLTGRSWAGRSWAGGGWQ